eukprot:m.204454 g.204454  ORF g.204454 m.204454 type:complete len:417 (+) comp15776_c0_seq31:110-1360(+)
MASQEEWMLQPVLSEADIPNPNIWYAVSDAGPGPGPRMGHSCCALNSSRKLFLFGGADLEGAHSECFELSLGDQKWQNLNSIGADGKSGDSPCARYEHLAVARIGKPEVVVFGGAKQDGNLQDMHIFNYKTKCWVEVKPEEKSTVPSPRTVRVSAVVGKFAYIFGGGHAGVTPVDDTKVHKLDLDTLCWTQPQMIGQIPKSRQGHTLSAVDNDIVMFGGMTTSGVVGECWILLTECMEWREMKKTEPWPPARTGHAAAVIDKDLYIFGGLSIENSTPSSLDDVWVLNTDTKKWKQISIENSTVNARFGHTMTPFKVANQKDTDKQPNVHSKPSIDNTDDTVKNMEDTVHVKQDVKENITDVTEMFSEHLRQSLPVFSSVLDEESESTTYDILVVYGGMDTHGRIFEDCVLLRPEPP